MTRIRSTLTLPIVAGALLALVAAAPAAAVSPDTAGCVGQFASTGGTSGGFGAVISGFARLPGPFGTDAVMLEAHSDRSECLFPRD
jgi:hypothetical protein